MTVTRAADGSQTAVITTEHSVSTQTSPGLYWFLVDLVNMANGDILELRVKIPARNAGTKRTVLIGTYQNAQSADALLAISEKVPVVDDSEFTLKQTAGTGRVFPWSVVREDNISLISAGTGTGQLDFTSGVVKANLVQILATALTETAGLLAGGFKKFFNVATPTGTLNSIPDAVAGATGGLFIAGTNAATTITTALTTTFTGNLSGSIGSLAAQAKADVNAEVLDVMNVDTFAEIGQETPAATQTIRKMIAYLYKAWRNRLTQTATDYNLYNDDATTVAQKATISDDGTTYDKGEIATGP